MEKYDLGKKPLKVEPMGMDDNMHYHKLYEVTPEIYPPIGDMKLNDVGVAMIEFKICPTGGIDVLSIGPMEKNEDKEKLK